MPNAISICQIPNLSLNRDLRVKITFLSKCSQVENDAPDHVENDDPDPEIIGPNHRQYY